MKKTIAFLMPVLNEERSAASTLDSIFASTRLPDEIIIADGGSRDNTRKIIDTYCNRGVKITVVDNPGVYAGAGRNEAFAASSSDILMLMDFGNTISQDWVEQLARPFEEEEGIDFVGAVFHPIVESDYQHVIAAIMYFQNSLAKTLSREEIKAMIPAVPEPPGALGLAVSRDMWIRVGGMPGWLRAAEDKLFGRKMMRMHPQYRFVIDGYMGHHIRTSPREVFKQAFTYYRGNARTRYKPGEILKVVSLYLAGLLFLALLPITWLTSLILAGLVGVYWWKSGLQKVIRVSGGLKKWRYIPLSMSVVLARDTGAMAGYFCGMVDWLVDPRYKREYYRYLQLGTHDQKTT